MFELTYDELQHPLYKIKKYNHKNNILTKYQPCLYIIKFIELSLIIFLYFYFFYNFFLINKDTLLN